jgi:hypothetical protein
LCLEHPFFLQFLHEILVLYFTLLVDLLSLLQAFQGLFVLDVHFFGIGFGLSFNFNSLFRNSVFQVAQIGLKGTDVFIMQSTLQENGVALELDSGSADLDWVQVSQKRLVIVGHGGSLVDIDEAHLAFVGVVGGEGWTGGWQDLVF